MERVFQVFSHVNNMLHEMAALFNGNGCYTFSKNNRLEGLLILAKQSTSTNDLERNCQ